MHGASHEIQCQLEHCGRFMLGAACVVGEQIEQLWSQTKVCCLLCCNVCFLLCCKVCCLLCSQTKVCCLLCSSYASIFQSLRMARSRGVSSLRMCITYTCVCVCVCACMCVCMFVSFSLCLSTINKVHSRHTRLIIPARLGG